MLKTSTRATILELTHKGVAKRRIAQLLKLSRHTVREVIASDTSEPPKILRQQKAEPYRDQILQLYRTCQGNLVRVHEELLAQGAQLSYAALTGFCRRHQLGKPPKPPAGRYLFEPGQEIQHDTSLHPVQIGGSPRRVQTASAVLAYSRMMYFQCYPRFRRLECKSFLTQALGYFQGAPQQVMIDNTHVVVLRGTGREMIPVPEMEAFAQRYGFRFQAHAVGDANRSARVERPFHYIENNFLAGRSFADFDDLNQQARAWCEQKNASYKRHLQHRPVELYALEQPCLRALPVWVPEPDLIHQRIVDVNGYVTVHTNRYSVPNDWIGRQVQVRETTQTMGILLGQHTVAHRCHLEGQYQWITRPEHRASRQHKKAAEPPPELEALHQRAPELASYVDKLRQTGRKPFVLALRQILRMLDDYPRAPLLDAARDAQRYGLYDLDRFETMVLQRIDRDFFPLEQIGDPHDR